MKDYSELKRLAETADKKMPTFGAGIAHRQAFRDATRPVAVLELLAELENLRGCDKAYAEVWEKARALGCELDDYQQGAKVEADAADEARAEVRKLRAENEALRKIISESASACGAAVSVECSLEFMAMLPSEIASVIGGLRKAEQPLEPVSGDELPAIGSKVFIRLGSSAAWVEHTVVGYYVWGNHGFDQRVHRVFVRVRDAEGYLNVRLLSDVRTDEVITQEIK